MWFRESLIRSIIYVGITMAAVSVGADPPLRMTYDGSAIVVSELEPGAEVLSFTFQRATRNYAPFNERRDDTWIDEDSDGEITIPLAAPVPPKTLVVAVELASGRFDVWTPDESPGREVALPAQAFTAGSGSGFERLEYPCSYLELFLARPGVGAWGLTTGDGTAADESPASDGWVWTRPQVLAAVAGTEAAPEAFQAGDLLFGVSPVDMEYFAVRIPQ